MNMEHADFTGRNEMQDAHVKAYEEWMIFIETERHFESKQDAYWEARYEDERDF